MQLMSVSAAARHLGYRSRSQLYKLMNEGWLDDHVHVQKVSGQRLLDVDGLIDAAVHLPVASRQSVPKAQRD